MKKVIRQGDVLLTKIEALPSDLVEVKAGVGRTVLAYGEVTGHCHAIDGAVSRLFEKSGVGDRFLQVDAPCNLTHEEHDTAAIEPGLYRVTIQRQYDLSGEIRRVAD